MRSKYLSYYVNIQKRKMLKLGRAQRFWNFLKRSAVWIQGFLTSKRSFFPILLVLVLFFIFPIDGIFYSYFFIVSGWSPDYYLTLWQVYGAIVGLSFVALFFFYEAFFARVASAFKNLEFRFRQEFYRKTLVQPLLFFNLFSLVYVGIVVNIASRSFQSITLLVASIFSICLLFAKAVSFFESEEMEKTRLRILRSEIVDSIDAEVNRRLSANLLLQMHEKNDYLKYELVSFEEQNRKPVKLDVSYRERISDIAIDKVISKMKSVNSRFYLKKGIGEIVSPKYGIVGFVPKDINDNTVKMLKKSFKLKREPARRDLHLALDDIEEQLLRAVDRRSSRDLSRFLEIYYQSIEEFLRTLLLYGIKYNSQQAKQGDFLNEWEPIFRIQNDFFHLVEISVETGNREIIRTVVYFVEDMLNLSKEHDDFLVFYRFKDFWLSIYCLAFEVDDKSLRDFIIDLLLRKATEFISTYLLLHLEHSEVNEGQVERYREYVISSILLYEQLLKATLERKSLEAFLKIDKSFCEISEIYDPESHRPYVVEIEARLMDTTLGSDEKKQLNEKLRIAKAKVQLKHDMDNLLLEIWLGVGGWTSELYAKDKLSKEETTQFLKCALAHFKDQKSLASTYSETNTLYPSFSHAWQWWELEDKPSGVVVGLRQEEWLARFYCIAGIILTPKEINANDSMDPTPNSESNLNAVKRQCQDIIANSAKWLVVMDNISSSELAVKAENFIKLHERAVEKQKAIESKWLIEQPVDEGKITEFKTEVANAWKARSAIRGIIEKLGNYVDKATAPENIKTVVLQSFAPKDAFVKQVTKGYMFVQDFGPSFGKYENETVTSRILASCRNSELVAISSVNDKIVNSIKQMEKNGYMPNVILVGSWKIIRNLVKTKEFKPKWERKTEDLSLIGFEGYFNEIPVFALHDMDENSICIIDLKKIGSFTQFRVQKDEKDVLHFDITFIDETTAKEYVTRNPKLSENEKGEKLSENEAIGKLQECVLAKIQERFEFTIEDSRACIVLRIQSESAAKS